MSETKITSEIFKITSPIADVYAFLSDFNRIGAMVEMMKKMGMGGAIGGEQMAKMAENVENVRFTDDSCIVTVKGMGDMVIRIAEKEEPKLIKLCGDGCMPFGFDFWIQLLEAGPYDTRLKLTFEGEMNMMLKMLLKGKLEKGINQMGEALSKIPYSMLK